MGNEIVWKMSTENAERYMDLVERKENFEVSEKEFTDELVGLPGYPLNRPPNPGDSIRIIVLKRSWGIPRSEKMGHA